MDNETPKTQTSRPTPSDHPAAEGPSDEGTDEMLPEYDLTNLRPNPYHERLKDRPLRIVILEPDSQDG